MDQNNSGAVYSGGAIVVVVVLVVCMKAIKQVFIEMQHVWDAFANMAQSFLLMAAEFSLLAVLLGIGIGALWAAISFTSRYVRMVKRATDLQRAVSEQLGDFHQETHLAMTDLRQEVDQRVRSMEYRLNEALKAPKVTAPAIEVKAAALLIEAVDFDDPESVPAEPDKGDGPVLNSVQNPY